MAAELDDVTSKVRKLESETGIHYVDRLLSRAAESDHQELEAVKRAMKFLCREGALDESREVAEVVLTLRRLQLRCLCDISYWNDARSNFTAESLGIPEDLVKSAFARLQSLGLLSESGFPTQPPQSRLTSITITEFGARVAKLLND